MRNKTGIMFVCLGNICRSPMAEFVFKKIASERGGDFEVASSATSREETANAVYPPAAEMLARHSISCKGKRAVQFTADDYERYDYVVCMESRNIRSLERMLGGDPKHRIRRLLDFTDHPRDIADPWYSGDFDLTYNQLFESLKSLLLHLGYENAQML